VECSLVEEHFGDAIDRVLPAGVEQEFRKHLEGCRRCRNAYEMERLSKQVVREYIKHVATPESVRASVTTSLKVAYRESIGRARGWLERLLSPGVFIPTLAGGVVFAAFILLLTLPNESSYDMSAHNAANDVINLTFKNFALIRSGQFKPALVACSPESIADFLERSNLKFAVSVLKVPCDSYSATWSEYEGVKVAHVLYKIGGEMLYVYQVRQDEALKGPTFSLPPAARIALAKSGWYTDPNHPNCNVVVWTVNGTLCVASSTMKKDALLAVLTTQ
jgi:hypothetical protein